MTTGVQLGEMTWPEVSEAAAAGRIVLLPIAAVEQHGPHLPVDTDNLIVTRLCEAAADRVPAEFVVAPLIPYGFNDHNMEFPGTISVRPETLLAFYVDVGWSLASMGFRTILWLNGHGSSDAVVQLASRRINIETPARSAMTASYLLANRVERRQHIRTSPPGGVAHACEFETSLYLHLRPELVKGDLIADEHVVGHSVYDDQDWQGDPVIRYMDWWSQRSHSGVEGSPSHASAAKGRTLFEGCVELLIDVARSVRDMELPERVDRRSPGAWARGLRG